MRNYLSIIRTQCGMLRDLAPGRSDEFLRAVDSDLAIMARSLRRLSNTAKEADKHDAEPQRGEEKSQ